MPPKKSADEKLTRAEWERIANANSDDTRPKQVNYEFLYKPHTLIALTVSLVGLLYLAYHHKDNVDNVSNLRAGFTVAALFILFLGLMVFPSGPFHRPHPLVWKFVFGIGVLYELFLIIVLFQNKDGARQLFKFFDPTLGEPVVLKEYATDCSFTFDLIWDNFYDLYMLGHFTGWVVKCVMLRDVLVCWIISITWELVEISLTYMLPNFAECWWDQLLLDVMISNAAGIVVGTGICKFLETKQYDWRGVQNAPAGKKLMRLALQFTPESWIRVDWGAATTIKRFFAIQALIVTLQIEELNHFFLKHLLWIPPKNWINGIRLFVVTFIGMPAVRQYYWYVTDPTRKRLGTQLYCTILIFVTEIIIIIKFSDGEFPNPMPPNVKHGLQIALAAWAVGCVAMVAYIFSSNRGQKKTQ
jgi:hypothetical protein